MHHPPVRVTPYPRSSDWWDRLAEHHELERVEVAGLEHCLEVVMRGQVDVVLVDVDSGCEDALDLAREVGALGGVLVLASTGSDQSELRAAVLDAGATLLVAPDISDRELVAQIRAACRLVRPVVGGLRFDPVRMEVEHRGTRVQVTETEWKLLAALNSAAGRYLTAAELMQMVWGCTTGPTSTISVHLHRLRSKLEVDPTQPQLIRTRRGRGYALTPIDVMARATSALDAGGV